MVVSNKRAAVAVGFKPFKSFNRHAPFKPLDQLQAFLPDVHAVLSTNRLSSNRGMAPNIDVMIESIKAVNEAHPCYREKKTTC
jgi:hypothetical protein